MRHLDLFSGIGGFALAARWTGKIETVQFVEIEPFCQAVLRKHWPDVPIHGDIKTFDAKQYAGTIDLLTGGFPCQPFSVAGKRQGKGDDRHLWPAMLEVIKTVGPRWILGENVAGIVQMELDAVLSDLEGEGYECQALVIPACALDAPHRRDRVWVVAHAATRRLRRGEASGQTGLTSFSGENVADTTRNLLDGGRSTGQGRRFEPSNRRVDAADADSESLGRLAESWRQRSQWQPEPPVGRVAHGIPRRVDRLKGLGNAIVPQVAQEILEAIIAVDEQIERAA